MQFYIDSFAQTTNKLTSTVFGHPFPPYAIKNICQIHVIWINPADYQACACMDVVWANFKLWILLNFILLMKWFVCMDAIRWQEELNNASQDLDHPSWLHERSKDVNILLWFYATTTRMSQTLFILDILLKLSSMVCKLMTYGCSIEWFEWILVGKPFSAHKIVHILMKRDSTYLILYKVNIKEAMAVMSKSYLQQGFLGVVLYFQCFTIAC